jgi:hypothetical protein
MTTLQITVENIAPQGGTGIAQTWVSFHDGSFDTYNVGETASVGLETLSQDGITGIEPNIPGLVEEAIANGAIPENLPTVEETIAGTFAASSAGMNGGVQSMVFSDNRQPPFFLLQNPGETFSTTITLDENSDSNRFFSYAAMLFPSNDAFIANDEPIEIFDEDGNFIGADFIVLGSEALDSGTEVNDENPNNVLYTLDVIGNGVEENGTIQPHPGFLDPGSGGVLDFEIDGNAIFPNADFTSPDYQVARISITEVEEPEEPSFQPIFGTIDSDTLAINVANQLVYAGDGDDLIDASLSQGNNYIFAERGNDTIILGSNDLVRGGEGADRFVLTTASLSQEAVIIVDFELGFDTIGVSNIGATSIADLDFEAAGNNTIISFNDTDLAIITGVDAASLENNANFVFE